MPKQSKIPRIFHGWLIVFVSSITYFLTASRVGAFGVFLKPICNEFGWSRAAVSIASSMGSMEGAIEGILIGFLTDKYGARLVLWIGWSIGAIGFVVLGIFVKSLPMFYFAYLALISLGIGAVQLPAQTAVANWFIRKRSRAFAILTTGFALGSAALTPVIGWLEVNYGWRTTAIIIGIFIGIVGLITSSFVRHKPEQYGYLPDGDTSGEIKRTPDSQLVKNTNRVKIPEVDYTTREAIRTSAFWFLVFGFFLLHMASSGVILHAIPLLTDRGIEAQAAANFLGLSFLWGVLGRLMWGTLGDFVPKRYLLGIAILTQAAGMITLANYTTTAHIYLYTILWGVGQGVIPVQYAIRGEYFGRKAFATIAGIMNGLSALGSLIGPVYAGWVYDTTGTYKGAFTLLAIACGVGAVSFFLARRPVSKRAVTAP